MPSGRETWISFSGFGCLSGRKPQGEKMTFSELKLKPSLLESLKRLKIEKPTEVQLKSIPIIMEGKDVIIRSKTGSGKTFAFLLPILNELKNEPKLQAIILTPTRELAHQIGKEINKLERGVTVGLIYGGVGIGPQIDCLERAQIAVGTPGRVLDHLERGTIKFDNLKYVVLDEADRMLDMGFIDDVEKILKAIPKTRQTLLFSATMPDSIVTLAQREMKNPENLMLQPDEITVKMIRQTVLGVDKKQKINELIKILERKEAEKVMIFVNTKDWAKRLGEILYKKRFRATSIHSGLSQNKRNYVIQDFNKGKYSVLVATDVAARGLHIDNVTHVVNYDIPRDPKSYVHRIGRTGRAGKEGDAITFVTQIDKQFLKAVEREINMFLEVQYVGTTGKSSKVEHTPHPAEEIRVHSHIAPNGQPGDDWGLD